MLVYSSQDTKQTESKIANAGFINIDNFHEDLQGGRFI